MCTAYVGENSHFLESAHDHKYINAKTSRRACQLPDKAVTTEMDKSKSCLKMIMKLLEEMKPCSVLGSH